MIFVYGTLRRGEPAHWRLARGGILRITPARVRGRLVDVGPYLGLIPGPGGWVRGELIELRALAAVLPAVDRYEGPRYRRVRLLVRTTAGWREAWAYITAPLR